MIDRNVKSVGYIWGTSFGALCVYTGLEQEVIIILAVFVAIDFITGIASSISRNQSIASKRMIRWTLAKTLLLMTPFLISLVGIVVGRNLMPIITLFLSIFAVAELYSIIGNIYELHTGETQQEQDAITMLYKTMLNFIKSKLDRLYKSIDEDDFNS